MKHHNNHIKSVKTRRTEKTNHFNARPLHFIDAISEAIGIVDENEKFIFANKAACNIFETGNKSLTNRSLSEFFTPENFEYIKQQTQKRKAGEASMYQIQIITGKKNVKTIKVHAIPHYINNQFAGAFGIFNELPDVAVLQEKRKIIEHRFEKLVETMNEGFVVTDAEFRIIYANPVLCSMVRCGVHELLGKSIKEFIHIQNQAQYKEQTEELKKGLKSYFKTELVDADKQLIPVEINASPLILENRHFSGAIAVVTDVSEQRKIEKQLESSEEKFKTIMELLPDTVSIIDRNFSFTYLSPSSQWIMDFSSDELTGQNFATHIHPDDRQKAILMLQKLADNPEESMLFRFRLKNKTGDYHWIETIGKNYFSNDVINGIILISRVVDAQVAERIELEQYLEKLSHLAASKDKFFSVMTHQMINPFNSLIGISDLLLRNAGTYPVKKIQQFAEIIHHSAVNGFRMIENILYWSRLQTNRLDINIQSFDLETLLNESINSLKSDVQKKKITIQTPDCQKLHVLVDNEIFTIIVKNLISNAIKYSHQNKIVDIQVRRQNGNAEIHFKDYGVGISQKNQKKIFNPDEIFSTGGTAFETGTGMGLILCKSFVEKLNGKIWFESKENEGSCFSIAIPFDLQDNIK